MPTICAIILKVLELRGTFSATQGIFRRALVKLYNPSVGGCILFKNLSVPQNILVGPIWRCFGQKITPSRQLWVPFQGSENLENHYIGVKIQNCRRPMVWPIKTCARRALSQRQKLELNRTYQFGEKSQKPPENTVFQKSLISGGFLDFSPNW